MEFNTETMKSSGHIVLTLVLTIVAYAAGWGKNSQRLEDTQTRVAALELKMNDNVSRHEYDDVKDRLSRIENKIDKLTEAYGRDQTRNGGRSRIYQEGMRFGSGHKRSYVIFGGASDLRGAEELFRSGPRDIQWSAEYAKGDVYVGPRK